MNTKLRLFTLVGLFFSVVSFGQLLEKKEAFTHADTLRGTLNENRTWWDVLRYDVHVQPDYATKTIVGMTTITFKVLKPERTMQIDLQVPLIIDSIRWNTGTTAKARYKKLSFHQDENVTLVNWPVLAPTIKQASINIYYHGKPREAVRPPWDGGWIWKKDEKGRPWMSVACQGLGASVWYPCKDHQSDEPDKGASLTITVVDSLVAVGNGRLTKKLAKGNGFTDYTWEVKNPINNYNIIPYIGNYVNFTDTFMGEKGKLDLSYWVLDYNLEKAKKQFVQVKWMLRAFEYWMGPYPFYEDSYKLVDAPHLGMEHQSAVAYGNRYLNGYLGRDQSGTGWGLKWDFIIVHESGHEWFANNITSKDLADMWIHEGFTNYSETLFTEYQSGIQAGNEYNYGTRKGIRNDSPIIGPYGVNKEGSGDMYPKSGNMLHSIRHAMNNDEKFREMLRYLNKKFYHQTVTTEDIQKVVSDYFGSSVEKIFDQYLRTTQVPVLEYSVSADKSKLSFRWTNCVDGFNLPIFINGDRGAMILGPESNKWNTKTLQPQVDVPALFDRIEKLYYCKVKAVTEMK